MIGGGEKEIEKTIHPGKTLEVPHEEITS